MTTKHRTIIISCEIKREREIKKSASVLIRMEHNLNERQINLPMANINIAEQNGCNGNGYTNNTVNLAISNGLCMNNRDPVDLQFKDVTYTVNLGFSKGKRRS